VWSIVASWLHYDPLVFKKNCYWAYLLKEKNLPNGFFKCNRQQVQRVYQRGQEDLRVNRTRSQYNIARLHRTTGEAAVAFVGLYLGIKKNRYECIAVN